MGNRRMERVPLPPDALLLMRLQRLLLLYEPAVQEKALRMLIARYNLDVPAPQPVRCLHPGFSAFDRGED
jgi:hypothetical protein